MRILQVAPPWFEVPPHHYGGVELMVAALVDQLVDAGHEVTLLASGGSNTRGRLHTVFSTPPSALLGDAATELRHVMAVDDLGPFDVIHDHTLLGTVRRAGRPGPAIVHTLHGPWSTTSREVYGRLGRDVALVAISHDQASRAPGVPIAGVVHNGVEMRRYAVAVERTDDLVFVGRASPDKGPLMAMEVAHRLGRPLEMAIKVNEPAEHEYWDSVLGPRAHDLGVNVVFNASHERKVGMLARAHALLAPLQWDEPFGLVLAEAGACGAPVVAFARGAAPEIVQSGVNGLLVPPSGGVDAFVAAVEQADAIDPAACRAHIEANFSSWRMARDYVDLYERVVEPHARGVSPLLAPRGGPSALVG